MAKIFAISVSTFKGVPKFDRHSDGLNLGHVTKKAQLGELASDQESTEDPGLGQDQDATTCECAPAEVISQGCSHPQI